MAQVPTLDMRDFSGDDPEAPFVRALSAALHDIGFVSLVGHGIDTQLTRPLYRAMARVFEMPRETKSRYIAQGLAGARGYTAFGVEKAKDQQLPDLKEFWHVGRPDDSALPNIWPREVPEFETTSTALFRALETLGVRVLRAIGLGLGLPAHFFNDKVAHGASILRPLHYPPLSAHSDGVRSAPHEDINVITLLVGAGEPGLEVRERDGRYTAIDTADGEVVVNVGDMLQRLTNHRLVSTTHRVVNPPPERRGVARYSTPFFLHFNPEFEIATLPSCVDAAHPDRYPEPISAKSYLDQRLREIGLL